MYINQPKKSNVGLFGIVGTSDYASGKTTSASIINLNVVNSFVTGDSYVGGIVGNYDTTWSDRNSIFSNCAFSGFVRAYGSKAGGLIGHSYGGYGFSNLINYGEIRAAAVAGGITGNADQLNYCYNYGNVSYLAGNKVLEGSEVSGSAFGGIGGYGRTYQYCINFGTVNGISNVGGIYGAADGGTTEPQYCENRGVVRGNDCVGGIAGVSNDERVSKCKNSGIVQGTECVGGIVGRRDAGRYPDTYSIKDVYNVGAVSGENYVGGIVGYAGENTNTSSSYNIGSVSATGIAGAILCSDSLIWGKCSANDCFYEKTKTPSLYGCGFAGVTSDIGGITAKTASELKKPATYPEYHYADNPSGWITSGSNPTWKFGTYNNGYPYLSWESENESAELVGISLTAEAVSIGVGDTYLINVQPLPITATLPTITWKSSDTSVATVDADGRVTGKGIGSAKITASYKKFSATCTVSVLGRASDEYKIGALTACDSNGAALAEIPTGKFLITIPITKLTDRGNTLILLASYNQKGQYEGLLYARVDDVPVGGTVSITLPVNNTKGDIAQLKAFTVASFSELQPLSASVCFPAR